MGDLFVAISRPLNSQPQPRVLSAGTSCWYCWYLLSEYQNLWWFCTAGTRLLQEPRDTSERCTGYVGGWGTVVPYSTSTGLLQFCCSTAVTVLLALQQLYWLYCSNTVRAAVHYGLQHS